MVCLRGWSWVAVIDISTSISTGVSTSSSISIDINTNINISIRIRTSISISISIRGCGLAIISRSLDHSQEWRIEHPRRAVCDALLVQTIYFSACGALGTRAANAHEKRNVSTALCKLRYAMIIDVAHMCTLAVHFLQHATLYALYLQFLAHWEALQSSGRLEVKDLSQGSMSQVRQAHLTAPYAASWFKSQCSLPGPSCQHNWGLGQHAPHKTLGLGQRLHYLVPGSKQPPRRRQQLPPEGRWQNHHGGHGQGGSQKQQSG